MLKNWISYQYASACVFSGLFCELLQSCTAGSVVFSHWHESDQHVVRTLQGWGWRKGRSYSSVLVSLDVLVFCAAENGSYSSTRSHSGGSDKPDVCGNVSPCLLASRRRRHRRDDGTLRPQFGAHLMHAFEAASFLYTEMSSLYESKAMAVHLVSYCETSYGSLMPDSDWMSFGKLGT